MDFLLSMFFKSTTNLQHFHCSNTVSFCYNHIRSSPLTILAWDTLSQSYRRSKRYLLWLFAVTVIFSGTTGGGTLLGIAFHSNFKFIQPLFSAAILACAVINVGFGLVLYFYCDDIILAFAAMRKLQEKSGKFLITEKFQLELQKLNKYWKAIGIGLQVTISCFIPIKWALPFVLVYHDVDPYSAVMEYSSCGYRHMWK